MNRMLEVLGFSDLEERCYMALLTGPGASTAEVSAELGATEQEVGRALQSLEAKGVVSRRPGEQGQFVPAPPDAAIEVLVLRRQEELESARMFASQLLQRFQSARQTKPMELVEIISGREAVAQRFEQMQVLAQEEMLICDRPPYASDMDTVVSGAAENVDNPTELESLARGVVYKAIYDTSALEIPGRAASLRDLGAVGEQARTMSGLPMKLAIADRGAALMPLNIDSPDQEVESVLVHPSSLLDALVALFEALWERATPVVLHGDAARASHEEKDGELSPRDQNMLSLLAAGLNDQAVARQLGVGIRTVQRRINVLMDRLNARTRFQASLLASKKGWIE